MSSSILKNGAVLLGSLLAGADSLRGADIQWTGAVDDRFSNPNNWSNLLVPGAADTAIINLPGIQPNVSAIMDGDSIVVDRVEIGQPDGVAGSNELAFLGGQLDANEISIGSDVEGDSLFLTGGGTANVDRISMSASDRGGAKLWVGGGILNVGTGGIHTAPPMDKSGVYQIIVAESFHDRDGGLLDLSGAGNDPFAGVHDLVYISIGNGTLRVAGDVQDIAELSAQIRFNISACGPRKVIYDYREEIRATDIFVGIPGVEPGVLQPGDADQDGDFDQLDVIRVLQSGKYLTGQVASWGEGDWDGAPGGSPGNPPAGNGVFDQEDIIASLSTGLFNANNISCNALSAAERRPGTERTSVTYSANNGELSVDVAVGVELTSIRIDSATGVFTGDLAQNLGGRFDNHSDTNIFKATFGGSFGSLSFGNVAQPDLSVEFILGDLTAMGSLAGGGSLGKIDIIFIPEPSSVMLVVLGIVSVFIAFCNRSYPVPVRRSPM